VNALAKRLSDLERKAAGPAKYVVCNMDGIGGRDLTQEEEAARLEAAQREAGPNGTVIVIRWEARPWDRDVMRLQWGDSMGETQSP
jgi:hypothetical protein